MKRITAILLMIISLISLTSCEWLLPSMPEIEWRITSQELANEHFPKYVDYALSVIDEYDFEYEYMITNKLTDSSAKVKRLILEVQFVDGYTMTFMFDYAGTCGHAIHRLRRYTDTFEEATQTPFEYFEIMHKVNEFSIFDLGGDVNTFQEFLDEQIARGDGMPRNSSRYYYWDGGSMGKKGYELWISPPDEYDDKWYTSYRFEGFLKDDNIWEEKAS